MNLHGARQYAGGRRDLLLRGQHRRPRAADALPGRGRGASEPRRWRRSEVLVLDNASDDGSADAVRARGEELELIALAQRRGKAWADSELMAPLARDATACCSTRTRSSCRAPRRRLSRALEADPRAACAVAALTRPDGSPQASRLALPDGRHRARRRTGARAASWRAEPGDGVTRRVDWGQSAALLVRRRPPRRSAGWTPTFFVYCDEVDFQKRLADRRAGTRCTCRRLSRSTTSSSRPARLPAARIVEHRPRARPLHAQAPRAARRARAVRWLSAWTYALRALAAARASRPRRRAATARTRRGAARLRAARGSPRRPTRYNARRTARG